jgi:tRNA pseudouridine55 synthase
MDGILIIDKPAGPTSFDVVRRVRNLGKGRKAGHTGTLDPMATGLLPVCLGDATKIATFLLDGDKSYEGVVQLGAATDTYDATGEVVSTADAGGLEPSQVREAVEAMQGE